MEPCYHTVSDPHQNQSLSQLSGTEPVSADAVSSVPPSVDDASGAGSGKLPLLVTLCIIVAGTILFWLFRTDINEYGTALMMRYGQDRVDLVLLLVTTVSCTPLMLPVWTYIPIGMVMGYSIFRLAVLMAIGSAIGSMVTYGLGRYFSSNSWVQRRFPRMLTHPWTQGRPRRYVAWILLLGTASPIPCDVVYAAAGAKHFPALLFILLIITGRLIRYVSLGIVFGAVL